MPANLVNLHAVSKTYGTRTLLDAVSLGVAEGERVGVVGVNGGGKTTLVTVLAARTPPDSGRVTHSAGLRVGVLGQQDELPPDATAAQVVLGARVDHEWAGDPGVRAVLSGLFGGLALPTLPAGWEARVGELSGGERRRVALARLLTAESDLLILDEPTNHLDVEAVAWLAGHLVDRRGALVLVTHDRWLLDAVCTSTWEVHGGGVSEYEGGYSAYVLARAERARVAAVEETRRAAVVRKELAWLRRGPPARTSKPRFRIDVANALIAGEPPPRDEVSLARFASARLGKRAYELHDATLQAGGSTLLDGVTWTLAPGERVGLVGVNGSGKTTLLRALAGEVRPVAGRVVAGATVRLGYLSQEVRELDPSLRVLESVESVRRVVHLGDERELSAAQLLERFGFTGDRPWTPVGELSGGERRRLQLLRVLIDEPNVLLLDEPTNDLDIDTLTALEDLLDGWAGSLLVVSHDRYFLERVTDHVLALLGDGRLAALPGGVDDYLTRRRAITRRAAEETAPGGGGATGRSGAGQARALRKELARIERALDRLTAREQALHAELAAHAADYERVATLDSELRGVSAERESLEDRWLGAAEPAG